MEISTVSCPKHALPAVTTGSPLWRSLAWTTRPGASSRSICFHSVVSRVDASVAENNQPTTCQGATVVLPTSCSPRISLLLHEQMDHLMAGQRQIPFTAPHLKRATKGRRKGQGAGVGPGTASETNTLPVSPAMLLGFTVHCEDFKVTKKLDLTHF